MAGIVSSPMFTPASGPSTSTGDIAGAAMSMGDTTGDFGLDAANSWIKWRQFENIVSFTGVWDWDDRGTSGINALHLGGLPFLGAAPAEQAINLPVWNSVNLTGSKDLGGVIAPGSSNIDLYSSDISTPGLTIALIPGNVGATGRMWVSGTYFI